MILITVHEKSAKSLFLKKTYREHNLSTVNMLHRVRGGTNLNYREYTITNIHFQRFYLVHTTFNNLALQIHHFPHLQSVRFNHYTVQNK